MGTGAVNSVACSNWNWYWLVARAARLAAAFTVTGLIPTAYEPHDITFSADGNRMFVVNGKSATGPNPGRRATGTARMTSITYPGGNAAAAIASIGAAPPSAGAAWKAVVRTVMTRLASFERTVCTALPA